MQSASVKKILFILTYNYKCSGKAPLSGTDRFPERINRLCAFLADTYVIYTEIAGVFLRRLKTDVE